MANKSSRTKTDRESPPADSHPAWRLPEGTNPAAPRSPFARWLLALAILLQFAWIATLVAMALFVHWKK
jgi:hypothetical protein